jgi:hypothetical protein
VGIAGAVIVVFIPYWLGRPNARLELSETTISYRGALRVRRHCARDAVRQLVHVRIVMLGRGYPIRRLLFIDERGRTLLSAQEEWWSEFELDRPVDELAVPVSTIDRPETSRKMNRRYPGAAPFLLAHFMVVTTIGFIAAVLVIVGVLGTIAGPGHP